MWKSLGCGICWNPLCGFLQEDEGFNKWVWQCVWSELRAEPQPLDRYRSTAAQASGAPRIDQMCVRGYWPRSLCLHQASAAEKGREQRVPSCWHGALHVSGVDSFTCPGHAGRLPPPTFELGFPVSRFPLFVPSELRPSTDFWTSSLNRNVLLFQIDSISRRFSGRIPPG